MYRYKNKPSEATNWVGLKYIGPDSKMWKNAPKNFIAKNKYFFEFTCFGCFMTNYHNLFY